MPKFYFTYGTDPSYPFQGGWTEIEAPDWSTAHKLFHVYHPDRIVSICLSNYSESYCEAEFMDTEMAVSGNFGAYCQERIVLARELPAPESEDS